jgi:hypothetical protein
MSLEGKSINEREGPKKGIRKVVGPACIWLVFPMEDYVRGESCRPFLHLGTSVVWIHLQDSMMDDVRCAMCGGSGGGWDVLYDSGASGGEAVRRFGSRRSYSCESWPTNLPSLFLFFSPKHTNHKASFFPRTARYIRAQHGYR